MQPNRRSNYKEYLDNEVFYKDIQPTFDKVEIAASDLEGNYVKVIVKGFYNDFLDKLGNVRVLSTCDYNDTWSTSFILLDSKDLKGQIIDFNKVLHHMAKQIDAYVRHEKKKQLKKQKQEQRRRNKK